MRVKLRLIKKIVSLDFDVPQGGVWILTGLNGSGKTSLFAALYRMGSSTAFPTFFKGGPFGGKLDTFEGASVTYVLDDGRSVSYRYGGQRWRASPTRAISILDDVPFDGVHFIDANPKRIEPFPEEITVRRRLSAASDELRSFLSYVLDDVKWRSLGYVNTRRGIGSQAYLIPYSSGRETNYYSEKSFSLGELCVLKLARKMLSAPDESLILVDEVEMALHPQAQVRLLEKISEIAEAKNLTVIFSTHSATLIKSADRRRLIFLSNDGSGRITPFRKIYPAAILGDLAFGDELAVDYVFYVEDVKAKLLLTSMIQVFYDNNAPVGGFLPSYRVVPVGGYDAVIRMLEGSSAVLPRYVKTFAFLDADVSPLVPGFSRDLAASYATLRNRVSFLPCTPELGLVEFLGDVRPDVVPFIAQLQGALPGHRLNIRRIVASGPYLAIAGANPRDVAKGRLSYVIDQVRTATGAPDHQIYSVMFMVYARWIFASDRAAFMRFLGPVLNPL